MRKKFVVLLLTMLVLAQVSIFLEAVYAGSATADCGDGVSVSCSGYVCWAIDGIGCGCNDRDGRPVTRANCVVPE